MDDLNIHINQLRDDFTKRVLDESHVNQLPYLQFNLWLKEAIEAKVPEVQAMNLATVGPDNKPSSRILYLREVETDHFYFYTNYHSKKAEELKNNSNACLTFFWPELERQVRIEGVVSFAEPSKRSAYFNTRPFDSKIGAYASKQSHPLTSRKELEDKIAERKNKFTPENISRPDFWGGFVLKANYYEFWQGRKSRLHDRIIYKQENSNWNISRLSP